MRACLPLVCFALGAWLLQQRASLPSLWWAYLLALCLLLRWLHAQRLGRARLGVDALLGCACGFVWAAVVAHLRLADALPPQWEGMDVQVQGVVAELPHPFDGGVGFRFDVERVHTPMARVPSRIQLVYYRPSNATGPNFHAGERWRLSVRLKRPHANQNPHLFDREYWLLEHGVRATGYVRPKAAMSRIDELAAHPAYRVERARERLRSRIASALPEGPVTAVLVALAVGDQAGIGSEAWQLFTRTGVNHLISISGLHITLLSTLAAVLVGACWRASARLTQRISAQRAGLIGGLLVAWSYALIAGMGVPAQRTVLMLTGVVVCLCWARRPPASVLLATALVWVLVFDPFAVMAAGFWLSFGAVALLLYVSTGRIAPAPAPWEWVRAQWALTLGLVPLLLLLFQQFSLISPLANAFAIPLISLVVVPLTLLGMIGPGDGVLHLAHVVMEQCIAALRYLDQVPGAVWSQAAPPPWTLWVAALGVAWMLAPKGFAARWMGALAIAPVFLQATPAPRAGEVWMDVLDVGQGLAVLLRTQAHSALFDAGPRYSEEADAGDRIVLPYLRAAGVAALDMLIVSHDDEDHSGGAGSVMRALPVRRLLSSLPAGHGLHALAVHSEPCGAGQRWEWEGVSFEMLHPFAEDAQADRRKDNNRSCVLRVRTASVSALLPADIEAAAEARLLRENPSSLRADILLAPHHGSGTSSTPDFVRAVAPKDVIFTNGYRNHYGHPKDSVVQRYVQLGARTLRTDRDGALRYRLGSEIEVGRWRAERRRYWHGG